MVSSAVMGAGAVRNTPSGTASKSSNTKNKSSDFKSVMAASISKNTSNAGTGSSDSKLGIADDVKSVKDQNTTDTKNTKADTDAVDKKQNAADTGKADKTDKSKQDEKVNDVVQNVKDTIKEELDVSDEDIAKAMEVLGITDNDLLSVVKVTELVSALTGADSITLITDDDMSGKLTSVLDAVNTAQEDIADMLNTDVDDAVLVVRTDAVVKKDTDETAVKNTDSSITDSETESLSDVLAAKVTAQGSSKHEESTGEHTGEQNHNTQSYGGVADSIIQSMKDSFADIVTEDTSRVSEADIVNQVIDQIKLSSGRELTSIEVMLNPERLGSVHVTVTAKNGILSAQIAAQNEQVKTALENQVTALKENFQNQGIKVEAVEITVMTHQFEAGQNFGQNESERKQSEQKINKKLNLSDYMDDEDETVSAQDIRRKDSIQNGNSSVEYMA